QTGAFADTLQLSNLEGNSSGFLIAGNEESGWLGAELESGDINGDGFGDVLISAPFGRNDYGDTHVVFGQSDAFADTLNVSSLDGSNGFRFRGNTFYDKLGLSIGSGDINGDGFDDLLVADYAYYEYYFGKTHVLFGGSSFPAVIDDFSLDGSNGFFFTGLNEYELLGNDFASFDLNGDGMDELITSAKYLDSPSGEGTGVVYTIFGFDDPSVSEVELSSLDGSNGFVISESVSIGTRIVTGDLDGDGHHEIISSSNIVGGGRNWLTTVFFNTINQLIDGDEGFRLLSTPTHGPVFDELLNPFFTQGFAGSDTNSVVVDDNVWTWDTDSQAWLDLSNQATDSLAAGQGFLFYIFSDDNGLDVPGNAGFPKRVSASQFGGDGTFNNGTIDAVSGLVDGDFFLAGNPFGFTIDWDSSAVSKTNLAGSIYIWDDANAQYQTWNGTT
ncbi:MAG: FG-GAP repeat protein, partial [Balneolales bacterium]|nr:FG-GAP repeat protein [Balneolales bacterium]